MKPRLLIVGASGFIGSHWSRAAAADFEVWRGSRAGGDDERSVAIDITEPSSVRAAFERARPEFVTHLAAISDIDRCQREQALAEAINVAGAVNVARECARTGARMLFTSSDAVFDGTKGIYDEHDRPTPPNWYGQTKAMAEEAIASVLATAAIARLQLVLGRGADGRGNSFLDKVVANLTAGQKIVTPTYEVRNPIDVATLCEFLCELTPRSDASGVFHIGASDKMSRYDLVRAIAQRIGADPALVIAQDTPLPGRAPRGADDFLAAGRLRQFCKTPVPTCRQVIERALASSDSS